MQCRTLVSALLLISAPVAFAGPQNPPAGPIASTMKTLTEVEPRTAISAANTPGDADSLYRITAPGSYYLTANIYGVSGKSGIEIATDGVTIDLNGFTLFGTVGSLDGIYAPSGRHTLTIRNGLVRGWAQDGIDATGVTEVTLTDVRSEANGSRGVIAGGRSTLTRVGAINNSSTGILLSTYCMLENCIASGNYEGIDIGAHSMARGCIAADNTGDGFHSTGSGGHFVNCSAHSNDGDGFNVSTEARIEDCVSDINVGHGFVVNFNSVLIGNHASRNGSGAAVAAGIYIPAGVTRVRIENNTCVSNDYGIKVDAASNLIVGNRCSINTTNYEIIAGNRVGAVITLATSPAISGNSGGSAVGSADGISNLAY